MNNEYGLTDINMKNKAALVFGWKKIRKNLAPGHFLFVISRTTIMGLKTLSSE